jgi:hypothetical protein
MWINNLVENGGGVIDRSAESLKVERNKETPNPQRLPWEEFKHNKARCRTQADAREAKCVCEVSIHYIQNLQKETKPTSPGLNSTIGRWLLEILLMMMMMALMVYAVKKVI